MGGMTSEVLDCLAYDIWNWCFDRDIFISSQYLPGKLNIHANYLSRKFSDVHEWKLKEDIFVRIYRHFFRPEIDLFATRHNSQLKKIVSWKYDPEAVSTDAYSLSWSNFEPYMFPPFALIGRVIFSDKAQRAIIVVPFWTTKSWFLLLISALISVPTK